MQALAIALGVLTVLISEGNSLKCLQCSGIGSCTGSAVECPADATQCITGISNNTVGNTPILTAFKNCLDSTIRDACSKDYSFRSSHMQYQMFAKCCNTDGCNTEDIKAIGPVDHKPNGHKCGDCYSNQSADECTPTKDVLCTGAHVQCASFTGTGGKPGEPKKLLSMKGCISTDSCSGGIPSFIGSTVKQQDKKCTPAVKV